MNMVYKLFIGVLIVFLFTSSVFAKEQRVYDLTLKYDKGTITKQSIIVTIGIFNEVTDQPANGYRLELKSFDNKILYNQKFSFDLTGVFVAPPGTFDGNGRQIFVPNENTITVDQADKEIIFPFFPNGKEIDIFAPDNKKVLTISVAHFAEITPTPPTPAITTKKLTESNLFLIIGGYVVILAVVGLVYWKIKSKENATPPPKQP